MEILTLQADRAGERADAFRRGDNLPDAVRILYAIRVSLSGFNKEETL